MKDTLCNMAIDSLPLGQNIFESFDYSGVQLYGLEHLSLSRAILNTSLNHKQTCLRVELKKCYWSNGTLIEASDYLQGLNIILKRPFFSRIVFRCLNKITHNGLVFSLYFKWQMPHARDLLNLPNWVPYNLASKSLSGHYKIGKYEQGKFWNIINLTTNQQSKVYLVNTPEENLELYKNRTINYCADTAIPLNTDKNKVAKVDTGIVMHLAFAKSTNLDFRKRIYSLVHSHKIHYRFKLLSKVQLHTPESYLESSDESFNINLAFDDFYPNKEVARYLKHLIESQSKIKINLIKDNYYSPFQSYDLKILLHRPMANNYLYQIYNLFTFPAINNKEVRKKLIQEIKSLEQSPHKSLCFNSFFNFGLSIPLVHVPSLQFKSLSTNPIYHIFGIENELESK